MPKKVCDRMNDLGIWICVTKSRSNPALLHLFSDKEMQTYLSLKHHHLREFYAEVHSTIRQSVGALFQKNAEDISILQLPCPACGSITHGPPAIKIEKQQKHFSLSKSDPYFAFCVADYPIGIDIEKKGTSLDGAINDLAFSTNELQKIEMARDENIALKMWVRKEAALKAKGIGLVDSPALVDVTLEVEDNLFLISSESEEWYVLDCAKNCDPFELAIAFPKKEYCNDIHFSEVSPD